jgi:hypothetical protein
MRKSVRRLEEVLNLGQVIFLLFFSTGVTSLGPTQAFYSPPTEDAFGVDS